MTESDLLRRCKAAGLPDDWARNVLSKAKRLGLIDELYVDTLIADALIQRAAQILSVTTREFLALRRTYTAEIACAVAEKIEPQVVEIARRTTKDVLASPARLVRQSVVVGMFALVVGSAAYMAGAYSAGNSIGPVGTFFWFVNQALCLAACGLIYFFRTPLRRAWAKVKEIM